MIDETTAISFLADWEKEHSGGNAAIPVCRIAGGRGDGHIIGRGN